MSFERLVRPPRRAVSAFKLREHLLVIREAPLFALREDHLAVDDHVELADLPGGDGRLDARDFLNFGRETRGLRFVVSNHAVLDRDVHSGLPTMTTRSPPRKGLIEPGV